MINKAFILGRLGRDPEIRYTQSGAAVCRLSVATSRKWRSKDSDEWLEETEWHNITVWGKQAESCEKYLSKGRQVHIEGRLKTSSYDKDGEKRYKTEVVAERVTFVGGREDGERSGGGSKKERSQNDGGWQKRDYDAPPGPEDDDIPF